jgi:hypothetical protein
MQPHQREAIGHFGKAVRHHLRLQKLTQALQGPQQQQQQQPGQALPPQPQAQGAPMQPPPTGGPAPQQPAPAAPLALSKAPPPVNPTAVASVQNTPRNALASRGAGLSGRPAQSSAR